MLACSEYPWLSFPHQNRQFQETWRLNPRSLGLLVRTYQKLEKANMASEREGLLVGFAGLSNGVLGEGADRHVPGQLWDSPPCMPTSIWPTELREGPALCWGYSLNWVVPMAR